MPQPASPIHGPTPSRCPACGETLLSSGFCGHCTAAALAADWESLQDTPPGGEKPPQSPSGLSVPGWELGQLLGAGGQGRVFLAVRVPGGTRAAVKLIYPASENAAGHEAAARLQQEAALLARLSHPNIVSVLEWGEAPEGLFFLATEFVDGCDLARLMRVQRPTPDRALEIAASTARALEHAHASGVVHRDVKPSNILIASNGAVKLADFALSRLIRHADGSTAPETLTGAESLFGSAYYIAPEMWQGATTAGPASDLYALGVLLYEMLAGAPPVGRFQRLSEKCSLPREVDALVESLLAENPADRPASAGAVARSLDRLRQRLATGHRRSRQARLLLGWASAVLGLAAAMAAGYSLRRPAPAPPLPIPSQNERGYPNPAAASRQAQFVNSLGMHFLPVPGLPGRLVSQWETRWADWRAFLSESRTPDGLLWAAESGSNPSVRQLCSVLTPQGWQLLSRLEEMALPPQLPDHPACGVNRFQVRAFASWLTWREQRQGRLSPGQYYRLPSDAEWSTAAGLPPETGATPPERHLKLPESEPAWPWGATWPPPPGFASYAGLEARDPRWPPPWDSLQEKNDAFPRSAPVGSFPPSALGLHDLWGNVREWTDSPSAASSNLFALRGASWVDGGIPDILRRDFRQFERPTNRVETSGFRLVLDWEPASK